MTPESYHVKEQIGIVLQNVAVFDELTVYENIDYFCGLYVKEKQRRKELVEEAIAFAGLEDYRKVRPGKLSGGLLRRLNIACGIAHKPRLIIMDEPTVAVDPQSRNKILEGIQELNRQGSTIIYTSHYMEDRDHRGCGPWGGTPSSHPGAAPCIRRGLRGADPDRALYQGKAQPDPDPQLPAGTGNSVRQGIFRAPHAQ